MAAARSWQPPALDLSNSGGRIKNGRPERGTRVRNKKARSHFQKGVMFLGASSRVVHLPGKEAPDLLHGVVSLFEVCLENLTPS